MYFKLITTIKHKTRAKKWVGVFIDILTVFSSGSLSPQLILELIIAPNINIKIDTITD